MSSANFFCFVGENAYALSLEISRWKQNFRAKHGEENMVEYEGAKLKASELLDAVSTMPFIAEKRLVLVHGIPKIEKEEMESVQESQHPATVLLIVDPKPDKRLKVWKFIEKTAELKTFSPLSHEQLRAWVQAEARSAGMTIADGAVSELLTIVGNDQWMLHSELRKLLLFAGSGEVTVAHVDVICVPSGDQVIWKLTDLVSAGKSEEALAFLRHRLERGEDPYGIWVILLNLVKNCTLIFSALESGLRDERSIASATKIHPFVVRGVLPLVKKLSRLRVAELVDWAASMDIAVKSGGIHASAGSPGELIALSERTILLCSV